MTDTYSETTQRLGRFLERDHERVGSAGKTIVFSHGKRMPRSIVLMHGLSASPTQFMELGRALHARGYNVLAPRLPRHGYSDRLTDALGSLTAVELRQVARESVAIARGLGEHVSVVGFSLGGLMAAWIAQHSEVDSVICIAPFLGLVWVPSVFAWPAALLMLRLPNSFQWWDPIKKATLMPAHGYPRYATHSVAQAYHMVHELFADAAAKPPRAKNIIMVTNKSEMTVSNSAAARLVRRWRAHRTAGIQTFRFTDLPPSHDIIEPLRHPEITAKVYPKLLELIDR